MVVIAVPLPIPFYESAGHPYPSRPPTPSESTLPCKTGKGNSHRLIYLTSCPKGVKARAASLICCLAKGIPIMVMVNNRAKIICVRVIQMPPAKIQIIFMTVERQPGVEVLCSILLPKGTKPSRDNLKH